MIKSLAAACLISLVIIGAASAQEPDAENCKDSPVLTRMRGCWIYECAKKDFDRVEIRTGANEERQAVEGVIETITYDCPESVSYLSIVRNAENALKTVGFKTVYSGPGGDNNPAFAAQKGGMWVGIETGTSGRHEYTVTIARAEEMEQQMVASVAEMEADIAKTGSCSIYGVLFDTGKSVIKPESEKCLNEVTSLLKKNASWKMRVEGHTDNVGSSEANLKLSQARADAVRASLIDRGIDAARLTAKGFGDSKPIAENSSEDGRAKNRRVTLTKM